MEPSRSRRHGLRETRCGVALHAIRVGGGPLESLQLGGGLEPDRIGRRRHGAVTVRTARVHRSILGRVPHRVVLPLLLPTGLLVRVRVRVWVRVRVRVGVRVRVRVRGR